MLARAGRPLACCAAGPEGRASAGAATGERADAGRPHGRGRAGIGHTLAAGRRPGRGVAGGSIRADRGGGKGRRPGRQLRRPARLPGRHREDRRPHRPQRRQVNRISPAGAGHHLLDDRQAGASVRLRDLMAAPEQVSAIPALLAGARSEASLAAVSGLIEVLEKAVGCVSGLAALRACLAVLLSDVEAQLVADGFVVPAVVADEQLQVAALEPGLGGDGLGGLALSAGELALKDGRAAWMRKGEQAAVPTPGANERRCLAGSIHWWTGRVLLTEGLPKEGRSVALFCRHLDDLRRTFRQYWVIHVVCDNANTHKEEKSGLVRRTWKMW